MNVYKQITIAGKKVHFFFNGHAVREYSKRQPEHPITSFSEKTPFDVIIDFVLCGIIGGYKYKGEELKDEVLEQIENEADIMEYIPIMSAYMKGLNSKGGKEGKPKAKS